MKKINVKTINSTVTSFANCTFGDSKKKEEIQHMLINLIHIACKEYKNNKEFELELNEFVKFINK